MAVAPGSNWEEHRRTSQTGSIVRNGLIAKEEDRLPNYIVKEIRDIVRQNNRPIQTSLPFEEMRFAVIDLETTGFYEHLGDEIISIGAVIIEEGRILKDRTFHELVDPHCAVPENVQALTGIKTEMLSGCLSFFGVIPQLLEFIDGCVLVGHHINFDLGFINAKLKKYCHTKLANHTLDTMALAQLLGLRSSGFTLDDLLVYYGIASTGRHTALGDSLMTAEVFMNQLAALKERSIRTLLGLEIAMKYPIKLFLR